MLKPSFERQTKGWVVEGMTPKEIAEFPHCLIAALLFILFCVWYSFSSDPDPLKAYASVNKAIPSDFFHECGSDLAPMHLIPLWLGWVLCIYIGTSTLPFIQVCPHMHADDQKPTGLPERLILTEQVLYKASQTMIFSSSSKIFVILITVPKPKLETIPKLQTDSSAVNNISSSS